MAFNHQPRGQLRARKRRNVIGEINITPLVDVLLVLLVIFMVAAPMMTGKVDINLPQGPDENIPQSDAQSITVSVRADGSLFLQDSAINISNLGARLKVLTAKDFNSKIMVRADKNLDYGKVMEVVRNISLAGFSQVVLVTEME